MKYVGILVALLIVYLVAGQMLSTSDSSRSSFAAAEAEAAALEPVRPAPASVHPAATPAPTAGASLRRPLDRARGLNSIVSQRNGAGEF